MQGNNGTFLRGGQKSDAQRQGPLRHDLSGLVPGPHEVHTGQIFFRPSVLRSVYAQGVYAKGGQNDTSNTSDGIYRQAGSRAVVPLARRGSTLAGLKGTLAVGVTPSA